MDAAQLAQDHWNETPLFLTEQEATPCIPGFTRWQSLRNTQEKRSSRSDVKPHHCKPLEFMTPWFGWYLVVKDQKPQANID